nr:MAG TPA: hypothetical protein [Caudoviricetes sp.]
MSVNHNPLPGKLGRGFFYDRSIATGGRRLSLLLLNNNTVSFCMIKN